MDAFTWVPASMSKSKESEKVIGDISNQQPSTLFFGLSTPNWKPSACHIRCWRLTRLAKAAFAVFDILGDESRRKIAKRSG